MSDLDDTIERLTQFAISEINDPTFDDNSADYFKGWEAGNRNAFALLRKTFDKANKVEKHYSAKSEYLSGVLRDPEELARIAEQDAGIQSAMILAVISLNPIGKKSGNGLN